jgi:diphthine methyl ester acylhydrolase
LISRQIVDTLITDHAILDIQWTPHHEKLGNLLAVATSTGLLSFYILEAADSKPLFKHIRTHSVAPSSTLVLSLCWHPLHHNTIGVTLSTGNVTLCQNTSTTETITQSSDLQITDIHHHELEAWTLAFSTSRPTNIFSGGDDAVLQCSSSPDAQDFAPLWKDRRTHHAGVTAILPLTDELLVTGSYDDHVRLILAPAAGGRRQVLAERDLGGGVWRLKLVGEMAGSGHG